MRVAEDVLTRVLRDTDISGRCWLWNGRRNGHGYGRIETTAGEHYVHRLVYEWSFGPLGDRVVLHACDTPNCVNPAHLHAGTQADNARDMWKKGRGRSRCVHAGKTHCVRGHEFTVENTRVNRLGHRYCRTCHRERNRKGRN
jgi:hypothetical protein